MMKIMYLKNEVISMKHKCLFLILWAGIILLLTASFALCAPVGKITYVEGRVDVLKTGKNVVEPVKPGDLVDVGDIYRTKTKSLAEITFYNRNILKIAPATRIEIKEYHVTEDTTSQVMKLHRGRVQAISGEEFIKKVSALAEKNKLEVHTPNAVAGIRGSNMLVGFTQGTTIVIFLAGKGYLYNPQLPQVFVPITAGNMSFVSGEAAPSVPTKAPESLIKGGGEAFIQVQTVKSEEKAAETEVITTSTTTTETKKEPVAQKEPPVVITSFTVKEPPPPQPPPAPSAPSGTNFTGTMSFFGDKGTFTGNIPDTGTGTMSAVGTYSGTPPTEYLGWLEGTSDKGGAFSGPLTMIQGSWLTRMSAFYVEGSNLYFLLGEAPGTYDGSTFAISGSLGKSPSVGTINLTPSPTLLDALENAMGNGTPPGFFPIDKPVTIGDSGFQLTSSNFYWRAPYLITNEGKKASSILNIYKGTISEAVAALPYLGYSSCTDSSCTEYALGPLFYSRDTTNKKFTIDALLSSIRNDEDTEVWYIGTYSMRYLGTYDTSSFRMAGTGTYVGTPANFIGDWGASAASLYYNNSGVMTYAGSDYGYFGGTTGPWTSPASFIGIGTYSLNPSNLAHYLMNSSISSSYTYTAGAIEKGFAGAIWKGGDASTVGTISDGTIRALYISTPDATTGLVTAGIMKGTFTGSYYEISPKPMWRISGTLTPTQLESGLNPDDFDVDSRSMSGTLSGSFGGTEGIYGLANSGNSMFLYTETQSLPFGIFNLKFGNSNIPNSYSGKPTGNPIWSATLGGTGGFDLSNNEGYWLAGGTGGFDLSNNEGYWLASASGTWTDTGEIRGDITGKALTSIRLYDMEGKFLGVNSGGSGTWIGQAMGSYTGTPLTTSLRFQTSEKVQLWRALTGTFYEAEFTQYLINSYSSGYYNYEFSYIKTDAMGMGQVSDDYLFLTEKYYFSNHTMYIQEENGEFYPSDRWDVSSIDKISELPTWMEPNDPTFMPKWYSKWPLFIDILENRPHDNLSAIAGMTGYPWNTGGAPVSIIGKYNAYDNDYTKPTILTTPLLFGKFYTPYIEGGTASGAYGVTLAGFIADDTRGVQMAMHGLYIGPNNQTAGILWHPQLFTGNFYKDIGMWDAQGTLTSRVMNSNFSSNPEGVTIDNLSRNIIEQPIMTHIFGRLSGDLGSFLGQPFSNSGATRHIKGQDWGIFGTTIWTAGFGVTTQTLPGTWVGAIAGRGNFGNYKDSNDRWRPDLGTMLVPSINGTLTDGVINARTESAVDVGKFMTMTKMGTISDVGVLGVYQQPSPVVPNTVYSWQGVMGGVWKTTQYLTFASHFDSSTIRFTEQHSGSCCYTGEETGYDQYWYSFNNEARYGEISFFSDANKTSITQRKYEQDIGPFSTLMWSEYTYTKSNNTFSEYTTGTDYPDSFSHEFFSTLALNKGYQAPKYKYSGWGFNDIGDISAIMGGVGDLWTATSSSPVTVYFLGEYDKWYEKPVHFATEIVSHNVKNNTNTTLDGQGAYVGYIGGYESQGLIDGGIRAIYLKRINEKTSQAGFLMGAFTGMVYDDIGMWQGEGYIYPVFLMDKLIPYSSLDNYLHRTDINPDNGDTSLKVNDTIIAGNKFKYGLYYMSLYDETQGSFGVWIIGLGGQGTDPGASWTTSFEYMDSTRIAGNISDGTKTGNILIGSARGYGADLNPRQPATWVSVGDVKGSFDPTLTAFQIGGLGVAIETNTYLTLAESDAGRAKLQALGIPAVEVGSVNLNGSWSNSGNSINVSMNNVKFYRSTTNSTEAPKIWATNSVGGSYFGNPVNANVGLTSGTGVSANFNVKTWDTVSNKWLATVTNGSAPANTLTGNQHPAFTFKGAAAGNINLTGGTFTGTAAGVAR